jgi:hypothetical protein
MVDGGRPVVVHSHKQIDAYAVSEQVRARAHTALDTAHERYSAAFGDIEQVAGEAGDLEMSAFKDLTSTTPASMAGVQMLPAYLEDETEDRLDVADVKGVLASVQEALLALCPAA